jgi:hypothetical protein
MISMLLAGAVHAEVLAGKIKSVSGEVNIIREGLPIKAITGLGLRATDQITTGPASAVGITLMDSTLLSFGPNSTSQLNEFNYDPVKRDGNLLISLLKGSMRFVTGMLGKLNPASVSIRVPNATIGVRGTDFVVSVEGGE